MRILNRVTAAGVLVVPMALAAAGVAVAGVAAPSAVPPIQIAASEYGDEYEGDECGGEYPCETTDVCDVEGDGFLEGLLNDFLGLGQDEDDEECGGDGTKFTD
ncbi:MAG: hypothetical protein ACRDRG_21115 [Pseudonocardiaceae bacterium]